ncbi:MAG: 4Fe-4S binding protein [Magnetococcales bacterium]|nr:4Fe-4S binding protein [Magnetococcales bacterium]
MPSSVNKRTVIIPIQHLDSPKPLSAARHARLQRQRFIIRSAFFALFILAPIFDLFRLDLTLGHFFILGQAVTLDIDPQSIRTDGMWLATGQLLIRVLIPIISIVGIAIYVSWRWGRIYCGWLCPHFSMVELINGLWRRTHGKPTLWERHPLPTTETCGTQIQVHPKNGLVLAATILFFSWVWAVVLLTYLLPPTQIYSHLFSGNLTFNQSLFIAIATTAFIIDFTVARHLFCRFGCAVGMAQSLAWFANRKALVVGFERHRVGECSSCSQACDNACPMRIKPRGGKGRIATCTQCGACVAACARVKVHDPQGPLLYWVSGNSAKSVADPQGVRILNPAARDGK